MCHSIYENKNFSFWESIYSTQSLYNHVFFYFLVIRLFTASYTVSWYLGISKLGPWMYQFISRNTLGKKYSYWYLFLAWFVVSLLQLTSSHNCSKLQSFLWVNLNQITNFNFHEVYLWPRPMLLSNNSAFSGLWIYLMLYLLLATHYDWWLSELAFYIQSYNAMWCLLSQPWIRLINVSTPWSYLWARGHSTWNTCSSIAS